MKLGEDRGVRRESRRPPGRRRTPTTADRFLRPAPLEVATGWVYGSMPATPPPETSAAPRAALDDVVRPSLVNGPCYVTFSGGRDSSAVLAAATALARREGHPLPVPVTRVYPDLPDTDESEWQRAVVDHLGLTEWVRLELRDGESDLLGRAARDALGSRGALWPPALQTHGVMFEQLRGGSLLTGEGGDAVLGARRITPLSDPLCVVGAPTRRWCSTPRSAALPRQVRQRMAQRMVRTSVQQPLAASSRLRTSRAARGGRRHRGADALRRRHLVDHPPAVLRNHLAQPRRGRRGVRHPGVGPVAGPPLRRRAGTRRGPHRLSGAHGDHAGPVLRRPAAGSALQDHEGVVQPRPRRRRHPRVRPHVGRVRDRRGPGRRGTAPERLAL